MITSERVDGPTPGGGDYMLVYFSDVERNPCDKSNAEHFEIQEYTKDGTLIATTYA